MFIDFLVEEPSMEVTLNNLLTEMLHENVDYRIIRFQGKMDLLNKLPARLRGYSPWIPEDYKIVVLIDKDEEDCHDLKGRLENISSQAGLTTKTSPRSDGRYQVLNRIAIEELEAWFFGDVDALREVYPRVPKTLDRQARYRDPDAINGGTWESLERILKRAGYFPGGYAKTLGAKAISRHMQPERNRSKSFNVFREGLNSLQND